MPSKIGNYDCVRTLGKGCSAKVKLAKSSDNGQACAIKIFNNNMSARLQQALHEEITMLKKLKHNNIVNMIEYQENAEWVKSD